MFGPVSTTASLSSTSSGTNARPAAASSVSSGRKRACANASSGCGAIVAGTQR